jgi:hypothetical protein
MRTEAKCYNVILARSCDCLVMRVKYVGATSHVSRESKPVSASD